MNVIENIKQKRRKQEKREKKDKTYKQNQINIRHNHALY
jgi:hypothetical protein